MEANRARSERTPQDVLQDAIERYGRGRIALSFSGAEDVVLIDMVHRLGLTVDVFSLDTGRLHAETHRFLEAIRQQYDLRIETLLPDPQAVNALVTEKGLFSFYQDGHGECCAIRKIEPLRRRLKRLDAWITGQRRDQSVTRSEVPQEQIDRAFSSDERELVKFNPLAEWTSRDVWHYIRANDVPYNALHDRGFVSIGCEPCTRAIGPHEHERAGRWWWEEATQKECGLHSQNLVRVVG